MKMREGTQLCFGAAGYQPATYPPQQIQFTQGMVRACTTSHPFTFLNLSMNLFKSINILILVTCQVVGSDDMGLNTLLEVT